MTKPEGTLSGRRCKLTLCPAASHSPRSKLKHFPPLSCLDRVWIALGVARGIDALHSAGRVRGVGRPGQPATAAPASNARARRPARAAPAAALPASAPICVRPGNLCQTTPSGPDTACPFAG